MALIGNINMRPTEDAVYTAVQVPMEEVVRTHQTASTVTGTDAAAFIVVLPHMEVDVRTAQTELMHTNKTMDPEAEEFLNRLRQANAEDLRNRVLERARIVIEQAGLSMRWGQTNYRNSSCQQRRLG